MNGNNSDSKDDCNFVGFFEKYVELEEKKNKEMKELHNLINKSLGMFFEEMREVLKKEIEMQEKMIEERRGKERIKKAEGEEGVHKAYIERWKKAWEEGEIV